MRAARRAREDRVMTRDRDVVQEQVTVLVSTDGRDLTLELDATARFESRRDHQLVAVFAVRSAIGAGVQNFGRRDDRHRDRLGVSLRRVEGLRTTNKSLRWRSEFLHIDGSSSASH
jgi:hypothetical protein